MLARRRATTRKRLADDLFQFLDGLLRWRWARSVLARSLLPAANAQLTFRAFLPIAWLDERPPASQFVPGGPGTAVGPTINGHFVAAEVALPPVCLYEMTDVLIVAGSSVFISDSDVTVERVAGVDASRCAFESGRLVAHGRRLAAITKRAAPATRLDRGFFLSGYGDWNYYHWMIELLPKLRYWLELAPELRAYPLLVSEAVQRQSSMMEALAMFCENAKIEVLHEHEAYAVGHLLHINAPNLGPFNLRPGDTVRVTDFLFRPEVIHDWRTRAEVTSRSTVGGRRLFLARSAVHRSYNDAEILSLFLEKGFEPIYLERMTLQEQIDVMASAELLAGPTGAAWTNLIFCSRGARALCWHAHQAKDFSPFSTIANIVGVDLRYLTHTTDARSTAELYAASYRMDPTEVEQALANLIEVP